MRVSTSKVELMVFCQWIAFSGLGMICFPKGFKYLNVLFTSDSKKCEMDRQIGAALALLWALYRWTVLLKRELNRKAKLSIYQSILVPGATTRPHQQVLGPSQTLILIPPHSHDTLHKRKVSTSLCTFYTFFTLFLYFCTFLMIHSLYIKNNIGTSFDITSERKKS